MTEEERWETAAETLTIRTKVKALDLINGILRNGETWFINVSHMQETNAQYFMHVKEPLPVAS